MAKFVKGDIVVVPFPFSDLTNAKRRPAFVLSVLPGDDIILCQITSRDTKDEFAIKLKSTDFTEGSLPVESNTCEQDDWVGARLKSDPKVRKVLDKMTESDNMSLLPLIVELSTKIDKLEQRVVG